VRHNESCNPATREPDYCECGLSQTEALLRRILERIEEERENGGELPIDEAEVRIKHVLSHLEGSPWA
jgi:hypothetical protein